jgi:uncharacterized protein (TIGR02246 family)
MKIILLAASMVVAAAPAMAQDLKASIDQANRKFVEAYAKGDAASIAQLYTEQATILPPGAPVMKGRKAIEDFWKQAMSSLKNVKLEAVDVQSFGKSAAREIGRFSGDSGQQQVVGKYVVVWKKTGKDWRLDTDIWNTDK